MITAKKDRFSLLKAYFGMGPEILNYGTIDGSVIWEVFGPDGFEQIMERVPEEAKDFPRFNLVMQGWHGRSLTPMPIMKAVIEKMIDDGEIIIED